MPDLCAAIASSAQKVRMATTTARSFAFQPWARKDAEDAALKEILARVNFERGHFRDITEASLQEEIAAEGALQLSEDESEGDDQGDGESELAAKQKPATREELWKAKREMVASVTAAQNDMALSLDFISLLLSKDAPRQAQNTMSPILKSSAPLGSLGTDMWKRLPVDRAREAQDELLATNVRMQGLQESADSLLAAANRFQNNVSKEMQYWSQILSISEEGWNICRIPGQQHRLGVSFGFSESTRQFQQRGVAELTTSSIGNIMLESAIGSRPYAVRAVIRKEGDIVGVSQLSEMLDQEETTLEARIRYARDSLFDEELYHEMIRESRTISSLGVGMESSTIQLDFTSLSKSGMQVSLDLVPLDEDHSLHAESVEQQDNALATAIVLAARLLLSQAHRDRLKKRSEVPASLSDTKKDEKPVLPILRPIMSCIMHNAALHRLNAYTESVSVLLRAAGIDHSQQPARFTLPNESDGVNAEALITTLMQMWTSEASLAINDPLNREMSLEVKIETTLGYGFGSAFTISIGSAKDAYRAESMEECMDAADAKLASALAKAIAMNMDDEWKCNEREALIVRDARNGEKSQSISVSVDGKEKTLSLNSLSETTVWRTEGQSSDAIFWNVKDTAI